MAHAAVQCGTLRRILLALLLVAASPFAAGAVEVTLAPPLSTIVPGWTRGPDAVVRALVEVPADAPADLGVGVFVRDRHGRWFQRAIGPLAPGRHRLAVPVGAGDALLAEPGGERWSASEAEQCERGGLFFWSASGSRARLGVTFVPPATTTPPRVVPARLLDLRPSTQPATTGARWSVAFSPSPWPANPQRSEDFRADLVVVQPDGAELRLPAYQDQPMRGWDRGDREAVVAAGAAHFQARFRPHQPGTHRLRLEARWAAGAVVGADLPPVVVSGPAWDGYVRVDRADPRFFSAGGHFVWPLGPNLRSVWDARSHERLGTTPTVDRGSLSYRAYLERLAAAGGDAVEIWLAGWNLGLEWTAAWAPFPGLGRVNHANAWRLERVLDDCERLGIRVNLVLNNHGQGSEKTDHEWELNPWNAVNGGPLTRPGQLFSDPRALAGQERLRRYFAGRYGDSPAILGWKLWSEVNLTAGTREDMRTWHAQAAARWREVDQGRHPVTTHWSGDWRNADAAICAQDGLGYICIDAYHAPVGDRGWLLADLLHEGLHSQPRGLARFAKPVLVTEFGGNWDAAPPAQLDAEHRSGPWAALVSGYGGAPMLWWFEWIDQGDRWTAYTGPARFLRGEDLRGARAASQVLPTSAGHGVWAACWSRPGRRLGYLMDRAWGGTGDDARTWTGVAVEHGAEVPPGPVAVEWWDPDRGEVVQRQTWEHAGGALTATAPPFQRHLAFKLWRPTP